ncbi:C6 transcription factor [Penicillium hispanicum]|uniref:C6 transcription factor n=1 Tax=Penicillium hispanicum TaxID=1080232 RepID=UPI002541E815|nr:C6 transcription factor [Penicillium hispanicum]KAJ5584660.1 C6 transcription factor [Penicillium hispanicum]
MFSTFSANLESSNTPSRPRQKRSQVARACDWCRTNRIKCDDSQPCKNCRNRGGQCSNNRRADSVSLPAANKEIQRLRVKVNELQGQLKNASRDTQDRRPAQYATPPDTDASGNLSLHEESSSPQPMISNLPQKEWEGIRIQNPRTGGTSYYGPLSAPYFGARMAHYLSEALSKVDPDAPFLDDVARLSYPPTPLAWKAQSQPDNPWMGAANDSLDVEDLSRAQEQYFLDLLWQSFHCIYPIIEESEFREYYESLWIYPEGGSTRRPSSLIDSLLAVCMQFGSTFLTSDDDNSAAERRQHIITAAKTSHALFHRAQALLLNEMECPSLMTLQAHIYCIVYLLNTSLLNSAHTLLGNALRIAQILRLQVGFGDTLLRKEQELHRRIWYTLYGLDCQLSIALRRMPLIQGGDIDSDLPGDSQEHASLSGSMLLSPSNQDITWLSFHVQYIRLLSAMRGVQNVFSDKAAELLERRNAQVIYDDLFLVEELAGVLGREVSVIYDWARSVPKSLKIPRKGSGESFSTERTLLNIDSFSPLWLQRQRLLLELLYHHLQLSNFRPFLRFPPGSSSITPLSDCHSITCLNHAMTLTNLLHQVLTETDYLRGWSPVFQYQWDAALCIIGFLFSNPVCPPTPAARKCLQTAISSLEEMGKYYPAATEAAQIIREVGAKAETIIEKFHRDLSFRKPAGKPTTSSVQALSAPGLTPEYLENLASNPTFGMEDFMGDSMALSGLGGGAGIPPLDGSAEVSTASQNPLFTMDASWMNDEDAVGRMSFFPE